MRQKRILKETRCFRRSHDRGRSQGNFKNGDKRLNLVHVPHNADMYVCDHTSSRVGREGVFAKMNVVAFRINVRIFEVTPKALVIIGSAEALPILCVSDFCERQRERETPVTSFDITLKSRVIMHIITSTARRPNASTRSESEPVECSSACKD